MTLPLATMTGVAMGAANDISSVLMRLNWGYPTNRMEESRLEGHETIGDADCFKIVNMTKVATQTYWVDSKTFLLRQHQTEMSEEHLSDSIKKAKENVKELPADMKIQSMSQLYVFTKESINKPLDAVLFQTPTQQGLRNDQ